MLFLGTEKFPDESEYNAFLNAHGGNSNAYTSSENTNYYFDVRHEFLGEMIDRFSSFFTCPLFTASATDREINAVHNENSKNLLSDAWRSSQLVKSLANEKHPFHKFGTGNQATLKDQPLKQSIDVRSNLLAFHRKYYTADRMHLAIIGRESLDQLQELVVNKFAQIRNNTDTPESQSSPVHTINKSMNYPTRVFDSINDQSSNLYHSAVCVVPVKDLRTLTLLFEFPAVYMHYMSKPINLISHLIGHESTGSILALLKSKSLAQSLSCGLYEDSTVFSLMSISIELTEQGLSEVANVISIVFSYINMIKSCTEADWLRIFNEEKSISEMNFAYHSKQSPSNYVSSLAAHLYAYEPEHLLSGQYLYSEFRPELIGRFLELLSTDNMIVKITSKTPSFVERANLVEQWYQTQYFTDRFSDADWALISQPPVIAELQLPKPNNFIATDFTLKFPSSSSETVLNQQPNSVDSTDSSSEQSDALPKVPKLIGTPADVGCSVWWQPDVIFQKPKANFLVRFVSPLASSSPRRAVLTALYLRLLEDALNEYAYNADLAGLSYQLYPTASGMTLITGGYNHQLHVLVKAVVQELHSLVVKPDRLALITEQLTRLYCNWEKQQPYEHAVYSATMSMETQMWSNQEKRAVIGSITADDVTRHVKSMWRYADITTLTHGNMTEQEALDVSKMILKELDCKPLFESQLPDLRVVHFQPGTVYRHHQNVYNSDDLNSAISLMFQIGEDTVEQSARLEVFAQVCKDAVFNQLRTIEQLGYLVWSGTAQHRGVSSFRMILQSGDRNPLTLEARSEAFLSFFRNELVSMTEETFAQHRAAVVAKKSEKDKTLGAETTRHWNEITVNRFQFDRREKEIGAMLMLTKQNIVQFFDQYLSITHGTRAKLAICVFGKGQKFDGSQDVAPVAEPAIEADSMEITTEEEEQPVAAVESAPEASAENEAEHAADAVVHTEKALSSPEERPLPVAPIDPAPVVMIESFAQFKRQMPLFPCFIQN